MRESELHEHIYKRSADLAAKYGEVEVGPGDDCAVVRTGSGELLLLGADQVVEGRHFEAWTPVDLIARKAIARSVSDIAAMGGVPSWALATAVLPKGYAHADELFDAMAKWGRHWGAPLIGGDIATGTDKLVLSVTMGGRFDPRYVNAFMVDFWRGEVDRPPPALPEEFSPVLRSGAEPGDKVLVTGPIGDSYKSGWHLEFEPRVRWGTFAAFRGGHPFTYMNAMIDLSDGLGRDASRIGHASGVRLEISAQSVRLRNAAQGWYQAFSEGEDYELLMCAPDGCDDWAFGSNGHQVIEIGRVRACREGEAPGATFVDAYGREYDGAEMGWDHGE